MRLIEVKTDPLYDPPRHFNPASDAVGNTVSLYVACQKSPSESVPSAVAIHNFDDFLNLKHLPIGIVEHHNCPAPSSDDNNT